MTNQQRLRDVFESLGNRSFLDPKTLMFLVVPFMVSASVASSNSRSLNDYLAWIVGNVFAIGLLGSVILMFRVIWLRANENFVWPAWIVFLLSGSLGALKGYLTWLFVLEISSGRIPSQTLVEMIVGATFAGLFGLPLASAAKNSLDVFNRERDSLLQAKALGQLEKQTLGDKQSLNRLAESIQDMVAGLKKASAETALLVDSRLLVELVDNHVRPLATSLYEDLNKRYQSFGLSELFKSAIKKPVIALPLAIVVLTLAPRSIILYGFFWGGVGILSLSIATYLSVWVSRTIQEKLGIQNGLGFFVSAAVIPAAVNVGVIDLYGVLEQDLISIFFIDIVWFSIIGTLSNMFALAWQTARANQAEATELEITFKKRGFAQMAKQRRALANQLHGEVQSRLMNLVLRTEASGGIEKDLVIQELEKISEVISRGPANEETLSASLERLIGTWSGFAEIVLHFEPTEVSTEISKTLFDLIEEGVTNAFRHGKANRVDVYFKDSVLRITDNGIGPTNGSLGIGSKIFENATTNWSLNPQQLGGSELVLELKPTESLSS
jgi:signal transduction histidine kinase